MEWFGIWLICGIIAAAIASNKGEGCLGAIAGLIFGPLGILFAVLSSGDRRPCPHCAEKIRKQAKICPHCQREVPEPPGFWS